MSTSEEQLIRGVVRRVTFRNPENGYSVLQLAVEDHSEQITVVGSCLETSVGAHVIVRGVFKEHPKFGRQLSASSITETAPESPDALATWLGSGFIKGIGPKTAQKLVETFGQETVEIIQRHPEKLAAVEGIGSHKAELITSAFAGQSELREIMRFLLEHNISQNLALKIYERYGARAIETLSRDPYLLARTGGLRGVGFLTADAIAMNLGLTPDSPQRLKAGVYYALEKAVDEGHCYLSLEMLCRRARLLLGLGDEYDLLPAVEGLAEEHALIREEDSIYLGHLLRAEEFVARFAADRAAPYETPEISQAAAEECLAWAESELKITFSHQQRQAVFDATHYPLLLVTGGPGCGKTTLIKALSLLFTRNNKRLALAAPTGRAAQRMAQVCGLPARTIHRLLKFDPSRNQFVHGITEPLEIDALIVDEASMIDLLLARDLLCAIPKHASLILVGDKDQLPSVGPGRVFGDLLTLREIRTASLSQLFRRAEESMITSVAHTINTGEMPTIPEPDGVTRSDAYFIAKSDAEEAALTVEKLVADQLPRKFQVEMRDICVLTPSNRGPLGTIALNKRLQDRLNPLRDPEQQLELGETVFRVGDRVCQRVNNYQIDEIGVFNGDLGEVYQVDRRRKSMTVEMWDGRLIRYEEGELSQLSLAYAVTVHRSQGSEIPCVVMVLHESHFTLLERQLVYTGVTRAKKLLVVVGSRRALSIASRKASTHRRCTRLRERIEQILRS